MVKHLTTVCGVVERRHTLPILSNILLSVEDSQLSMTATDLEVEISTTFKIHQGEAGQTTVSARKFLDICRTLPARVKLDVHCESGQFQVRSGRSRFVLSTLPTEDFPNTETTDEAISFELTQQELKQLLHKTVFCMAHQDVRYYLNGLLLELDEEAIRAVATDGHRLAMAALEKKSLQKEKLLQAIIPRKAVLELARLLEGTSEPVQLQFAANQMGARFQGLSFITKLIDGQFPDYRRVIPVGCEKQLIADRESFKQMLVRVNILTNDKYRGVRLRLAGSKLQATVTNLEQECAEEELEVIYQGEEFEIAFNNSYLIDALNAVDTKQVRFEFTNANSSCLIAPVGESETSNRYVVMPMRL